MSRLYPNLATAVIEALEKIFVYGKQAEDVVGQLLSANRQWGARDRKFVAENVYELTRFWRKYAAYANIDYRIFSIENIRAAAAAKWLLDGFDVSGFAQSVNVDFEKKLWWQDEQSFSDELMELFQREVGSSWKSELSSQNQQASVYLRTNTLKTSRNQLLESLLQEGISCKAVEEGPYAIVLSERKNLSGTMAFKNGWFEIQDMSSQLVAPACSVEPGMKVMDCCAGAGGKTLHLAALMKNRGVLIASDIHTYKLEELQKRAVRAGASVIHTERMNDSFLQEHAGTADRVLIDAPCTGSGTLRRKPDAKWRINRQLLDEMIFTQKHTLHLYSSFVRSGGQLIYATCSVFESENTETVYHFLDSHPEFSEKQSIHIPASSGHDGFFIAVLTRK